MQLYLCLLLPVLRKLCRQSPAQKWAITFFFFIQKVKPSTVEMKEGGVRLRLTVVDTPGFGDAVDNTDW